MEYSPMNDSSKQQTFGGMQNTGNLYLGKDIHLV